MSVSGTSLEDLQRLLQGLKQELQELQEFEAQLEAAHDKALTTKSKVVEFTYSEHTEGYGGGNWAKQHSALTGRYALELSEIEDLLARTRSRIREIQREIVELEEQIRYWPEPPPSTTKSLGWLAALLMALGVLFAGFVLLSQCNGEETPESTPEVTPEVTEPPLDEVMCRCDGPNLSCDDGTVIEDDEGCLADCACDGPNLSCDDGTVIEDDEGCLADCACDGPNLACEDGMVIQDDERCLADCACEGPNLSCEEGTVTQDDEGCLALCACEGPNLSCEEGTVTQDDEGCLALCACDGPNLACEDGTVIQDDEGCLALCACDGPDFYCEDGTVIQDDEGCLADCACDGPNLSCEDGTVIQDDEGCLADCACDGPDLRCEDDTVVSDYEGCECICDGYDLYCNDEIEEIDSAQCGYCALEEMCGNGICDTACENTDLCPDDCECYNDGECAPGEGSNCPDCGDEGGCGAPCSTSEQCIEGLSCFRGICWESCECGGNCGGDEDVTCWCENSNTSRVCCSDGSCFSDKDKWDYCPQPQ